MPVSEGEAGDSAYSFCTPVNIEGVGKKTSVVSILDGTPFNALALFHFPIVAASGDFSGELMHCAATRPGVGPLRFGGYEVLVFRLVLSRVVLSSPSFKDK